MKTIILDTSFILNAIDAKVDFFRELERLCLFHYKIAIIDKTIKELDTIIEREGKQTAKLAKKILEVKKVHQIKTLGKKSVDDLIVENTNSDTLVATMDAELKRRLKKKGTLLVVIRSKSHLEIF